MLKISQKIKDKIRGKITKKRNKQQQTQDEEEDQHHHHHHRHHHHHFHHNHQEDNFRDQQQSSSEYLSSEDDDMTTATTDTRRRVKLYALNAERQWDDRGTGHVSSSYVDRLKGISLLVRAESDGSLLLESKIQPDTAYQKQQDTLIVWSEGDNFDLALSFQEKIGCDEIWEKICQVQGKDPSVEITQDIVEESEDERFEEMSDTAPPVELPPCELSRLEDIAETIQNSLTTQVRKEKLALALESENYIKKLLSLFRMCEDLENTEGLHYLFDIFKNIFLLNKNALFEIMFAEDTIFDVVGCLEFDPNLQQPKKHRQYLKQLAKFREAVPIRNQDLLAKIHQTYRVQYIQDIILPTPSVFVEDNMLNTLSSFIFFNKVEIVTLIQEDEKYLIELFSLLTDPNTPDAKRRDTVLFLKEFCNYAQNLQPQGKDAFYKTLTCLGILQALEITLVMNDQKTKSASIDILTAIVEYSPSIVRNYTLQQMNKTDGDQMLINIAIEQMLSDSEPELGGAVQLMGVIRILLDPENMLTEKTDFLNLFYKYSIQTLVAPLLSNTVGDTPQNETYQTAQLLGLVLEILSFCVEHHSYHIKSYIIQKDLLKRILVLMKSNHTFLVLGALRLLRKIIQIKDEFYNRHIVKGNLFAPVVDAFVRNRGRYNLLESAILELFDFIKIEDIKSLCVYFVENFSKEFDSIEYVQTFKYLKSKYDQFQDRLKERDKISDTGSSFPFNMQIIRNRYRRDTRQLEEEEESWFNEEEDFSEELDSYSVMKSKATEKNGKLAHTQSMSQNSPPHQHQTSSSTTSVEHPLHHFQQQIQQNHHLNQHKPEDENKENIRSSEDLEVDDKNSLSSSSSSNDSSSCENSRSSPTPESADSSTNTTTDNQTTSPKAQEDQLSTEEDSESESNSAVAFNESDNKQNSEEPSVNCEETTSDSKSQEEEQEEEEEETKPMTNTTPDEPVTPKEEPESIKENSVDSSSNGSKQEEPDVEMKSDDKETNNRAAEEGRLDIAVPEGVQTTPLLTSNSTTPPTTSSTDDNTNTNEISSNKVNESAGSDSLVPPCESSGDSKEDDKEEVGAKKGVLKGLVDYEGDSDEEEEEPDSSPKEKKARLD